MTGYIIGDSSRDIILNVSKAMFYKYGYSRTSIREICRRGDVSNSRVNYHFESKANLANIIAEDFLVRLNKAITKAISDKFTCDDKLILKLCCDNRLISLVYENKNLRVFFREISMTGQFYRMYLLLRSDEMYRELNSKRGNVFTEREIIGYSAIYSNALSGLFSNIPDEIRDLKDCDYYTETYEKLFVKLIDMPRTEQDRLVEMVNKCVEDMVIDITDFDNFKVYYRT